MNPADKSLVQRRDELIEAIQLTLEPQLLSKPLTVEQHRKLQELIAHFAADVGLILLPVENVRT